MGCYSLPNDDDNNIRLMCAWLCCFSTHDYDFEQWNCSLFMMSVYWTELGQNFRSCKLKYKKNSFNYHSRSVRQRSKQKLYANDLTSPSIRANSISWPIDKGHMRKWKIVFAVQFKAITFTMFHMPDEDNCSRVLCVRFFFRILFHMCSINVIYVTLV